MVVLRMVIVMVSVKRRRSDGNTKEDDYDDVWVGDES